MADFFQHLFLVMVSCLGLLGVPLPLPMPPLPEDPALLRVAPADSLLFVQWFGGAAPAAEPTNRSERLAAEPEVRAAVHQLVVAARSMLEHELGGDREGAGALALFDLTRDVLQRPGCFFFTGLEPFAGAVVVQVGDDAVAIKAALRRAIDGLVPEEATPVLRTIGGVEFEMLPLPIPGGPPLGWAMAEDHLAVFIGDDVAQQVVAGLRGDDAGLGGKAGLQKLRAGCNVERPVLRTYADIARLSEQVKFAQRFWQPLGLSGASAALAESGLEGDGFISRLQLAIPEPDGLLGELGGRPLSQDDLGLIPEDATTALAIRVKQGRFENAMLEGVAAFAGERIDSEWSRLVDHAKQRSWTHFRDDLIVHADDCVVAWNALSDGGVGFSAATVAVPLRDGEAFDRNISAMWEKMTEFAPNKAKAREDGERISWRAYLERFEHDGEDVWWVDLIDRDFPFGLSWANTEHHFLFGLQPQPVRGAIERSHLQNFDHALVRKPLVSRRGPAVAMLYLDLQALLQQAYGPALMLFQSESRTWQRDGFDFDLADLPQLQPLARHLGPEIALLEKVDGGFLLTRRGSVPVFDPLLVTCGMACLMR